ncbi:hypothetical protein B0H16DRAFT_1709821 [Mycena metata]|uniref:Uncharacterized protein n=1 Tax=Mycena metata TaxID=1033252 RepID=A0AAD7KCN4_9AGAR|nr:hypothetical protein B0H16DRAFT_1709821 [Mycena metata]
MPHLQVHVPLSPLLPELASPVSRNKPLPRLPTTVPAYAAASLLSLLDTADAELVLHVSRVHAGVAPSLVAAKEKLQRSQLEDQLATAIAKRPPREELEEKGILKGAYSGSASRISS